MQTFVRDVGLDLVPHPGKQPGFQPAVGCIGNQVCKALKQRKVLVTMSAWPPTALFLHL